MATTRKVKKRSKKAKKEELEIVLPGPTDLIEPPDELFEYPILVYGEKGYGKTSLLSKILSDQQESNCLVCQFDPGRVNLRIRQIPQPIKLKSGKIKTPKLTWPIFLGSMEQALDNDTIHAIGVDNLERCYRSCMNHGCEERGIDSPNDMKDYGQTWHDIRSEFEACLWAVQQSGKGLIATAHARMDEVEARDGDNYTQCVPAVSAYVFEFIKEVFNFAFYLGMYQGKRTLYVRHTDVIWAACGNEDKFLDVDTGEPLTRIDVDGSASYAYEQLLKGFDNQLVDPERRKKERIRKKKRRSE